jgi:YVTN family beta-propeller protein
VLALCAPATQSGNAPANAVARAGLLYVCNQDDATVTVIDMATNRVIRTIDLQQLGFSANARPHHIAVEPDGSYWYVTLIGDNRIVKFDRSDRMVGQVPFETPGMLALHPAEDLLFVARSMTAVNPPQRIGVLRRSDMMLNELPVFFPRPHALGLEPRSGTVYTASLASNQMAAVQPLDEAGGTPRRARPAHALMQFAVSPDGRTLVVSAELSNRVLMYDITSPMAPRAIADIEVGAQPFDPIFTPDGRSVYLGNKAANTVTVIDMSTRRRRRDHRRGPRPAARRGDLARWPLRLHLEQQSRPGSRHGPGARGPRCASRRGRAGHHCRHRYRHTRDRRCHRGRPQCNGHRHVRSMKRTILLCFFTAACASSPAERPASGTTAGEAGAVADGGWQRIVTPFAVLDENGTEYAHPFLGGLDVPRPQFIDIDGDGDLDLFVQERSNDLMFFENVGTPQAARYVWRSDKYRDIDIGEWYRFIDMDGDGDFDLIAEEPYSYIRFYRNTGSPTQPRFEIAADTLRDTDGRPIFADRQNIANAADIDCNGLMDLFLGRVDGTITRYEETRQLTATCPASASSRTVSRASKSSQHSAGPPDTARTRCISPMSMRTETSTSSGVTSSRPACCSSRTTAPAPTPTCAATRYRCAARTARRS